MNRVRVNVVLDNCGPEPSEIVVESVGASKLEQLVTVLSDKVESNVTAGMSSRARPGCLYRRSHWLGAGRFSGL